ncbi:Na-K-Cl cotransporter [Cyanobacterium aponinum AL20118]|uniref:Na-K-Cl cotransporter n=1 Tax=Cyanobacterium aponinum AL20115 TaxID=3090662 RepID=A0AAF0Z9Q2_9CHRO|nr:Na-K-Cl cotransporter [Cyanobacterium aponinum]MBD2394751.1 Na-K-Cl cotransporter [Cyanobacterium aponinum FACHB-4101]PHV62124.1 Na-K-Cl cotransporter [Cyanobacterium aponinum IPPAS B-1201]WPF88996.1 Na-K-Cl cotransporter [Cyanobacterium aponinum AL20115]
MNTNQQKTSGLGTFGGVYTPSILTILGVIMYLRFGWVVGNVGLFGTFIIVTLSNLITFLTALSVCAIATDRVVRAGGAYYMISRSLGIETGGAVGIPLYFAQALSVALYTLGFAESVVQIFPSLEAYEVYIALAVTIGVGVLALTSAEIAIKAQYFIMAAIALSLISFFLGHPVEQTHVELWRTTDVSFWQVFAVFFPAVTGIMAGVNMSGDLKDPTKALPIGTLAAVGTGYVIYMVIPLFLGLRADAQTLVDEPFIMARMSFWGGAIALGVWGATLSSAIGSILGAPRVLQALARDGILPNQLNFLGQGNGRNDEPRVGTAVTLGVAIAAVCLGDLNLIAPVLTMFFLTTYLVLNASAGIESFLQSPSFRPTFKVNWFLSFLGAVGCLAVMFLINAIATIVAGIIVSGIFIYLQRQELKVTWGDSRRGMWMAFLRTGIYQLDQLTDPKNWRPHIIVFSASPHKSWSLIELADSFNHKGLLTVASIVPERREYESKKNLESTIKDYLSKNNVQALVKIIRSNQNYAVIPQVVETYGIGALIPNTVLLGNSNASFNQDWESHKQYCQTIAQLHQLKRNIIILKENSDRQSRTFGEHKFGNYQRIDIWWSGIQANGSFMLLLAYLLKNDWQWRKANIFVKLVIKNPHASETTQSNLSNLIEKLNIDVIPQVIVSEETSFEKILHQYSDKADLIFLGLAEPQEDFDQYYYQWQQKTKNLPSVAFMMAANDFPFEEVLQKD